MPRLNLTISEKTDRALRTYLAQTGGKKGDLSKFVDEAVRGKILRETVLDIQTQNTDLSEEEAMNLANEAVAWARENRP